MLHAFVKFSNKILMVVFVFCCFLLVGFVGGILNLKHTKFVFSMARTEGPEWVNPEGGE